jgi:uncharacterized protein (DUF924 family)
MQNDWNRDVRRFWFTEIRPEAWFRADPEIDAAIRMRFLERYRDLRNRPVATLVDTPEVALAAVIVLDQFPRNMFRGKADAFATDALARGAADRAIALGFDQQVPAAERLFFYLPFEHSESLADQERAVALIGTLGSADLSRWAELHADIIRRFGRFPHRNLTLGRASTPEEQEFLDAGGFAG